VFTVPTTNTKNLIAIESILTCNISIYQSALTLPFPSSNEQLLLTVLDKNVAFIRSYKIFGHVDMAVFLLVVAYLVVCYWELITVLCFYIAREQWATVSCAYCCCKGRPGFWSCPSLLVLLWYLNQLGRDALNRPVENETFLISCISKKQVYFNIMQCNQWLYCL
jgi:hypothetical protein